MLTIESTSATTLLLCLKLDIMFHSIINLQTEIIAQVY